jgi:anaphase-promoting complex subunit 10
MSESPSSVASMQTDEISPPSESSNEMVEISPLAASWTLSSAKPGNGVEQLLDHNNDTFWQSDGAQPHTITIQFFKKTKICDLWLLFNYRADESYTPQQVSIRIGNGYYDLQEIQVVDLREPDGYIRIPLALPPLEGERALQRQECASIRDKSFGGAFDYIRTFVLQIAVIANHQNGRDTHIRGVRLFGPREQKQAYLSKVCHGNGVIDSGQGSVPMVSSQMTCMATIR